MCRMEKFLNDIGTKDQMRWWLSLCPVLNQLGSKCELITNGGTTNIMTLVVSFLISAILSYVAVISHALACCVELKLY